MEIFNKIGKLLVKKMDLTIMFVAAFILFIYFTGGDLIGGALTAFFALIMYVAASLLHQEYKKMYAGKTTPVVAKAPAKKVAKKPAKKTTKKSKK